MTKEQLLKKWQIKTFVLCWIAYAAVYFGRYNLSVAIPEIQSVFGFTKTQVGLIGSSFVWVYGIGQLINGYIGDKIPSRIFIFIGLSVTAVVNILFAFATSHILMLVLWALNGLFQSILWGPILKTLSYWFSHKDSSKTATGISTSMVIGYLLAWGLSGFILAYTSWKWVFWIPGLFILSYSFVWVLWMRSHPKDVGLESPNKYVGAPKDGDKTEVNSLSLWQVIIKSKLYFIVIACMAQGIIKDSIALWAPTFLMETQNIDIKSTAGMIILIPIMNFMGILFTRWMNKKLKNQVKFSVIILLASAGLSLIGLVKFGSMSTILGLLFLGTSSAMMFGANSLLLGAIPMTFVKYNKASSVAGFLDFCSYMAAGVASALIGVTVEGWGWNGVLWTWVALATIGIVSTFVSWKADKKLVA